MSAYDACGVFAFVRDDEDATGRLCTESRSEVSLLSDGGTDEALLRRGWLDDWLPLP